MRDQDVTVISRKFDGSVSRTWTCSLLEKNGPLLLFVGEFAFDVEHADLGHITAGTVSYEYYWLDRWYNVFRFHSPDGSFRNWYCNINFPPTFTDGVLDYIDLDIDVLIWPDADPMILDETEFEQNAERFSYPATIRENARQATNEILRLWHEHEFPFDVCYDA